MFHHLSPSVIDEIVTSPELFITQFKGFTVVFRKYNLKQFNKQLNGKIINFKSCVTKYLNLISEQPDCNGCLNAAQLLTNLQTRKVPEVRQQGVECTLCEVYNTNNKRASKCFMPKRDSLHLREDKYVNTSWSTVPESSYSV